MSLRRRHGFHQAWINLTPLIDMAMMLVVFFVLCLTTSQAAMRAVAVTLPEAGKAQAAPAATLEVVVDRAGRISVDGRPVALAELAALAKGRPRAALLADKDARHGAVVEVVEALRAAGVAEVYYATARPLQDW